MNELIKINSKDLAVKEFKNQRVVTFRDIDVIHERAEGTSSKNFRNNKVHFINSVDYFEIKKNEVGEDFTETYGFDKFAPNGILITESGYLMLVKSLTDDLAWNVQRELVNSYFRKNDYELMFNEMSPEMKAIIFQDKKLQIVEKKVDKLANTMTIDYGQQKEIESIRKSRAINVLSGINSPAYKEIGRKVFQAIGRDYKEFFNINAYNNTPLVNFEEAKRYLNNWCPDTNLQIEINRINRENISE